MGRDTHRTVGCLHGKVDVLGFQKYHRVLASGWFYIPVDKGHPDIVQPKVTLDGFVD